MDRGAWRATVHEIAKRHTQLKRLSTQHTKNPVDATKNRISEYSKAAQYKLTHKICSVSIHKK